MRMKKLLVMDSKNYDESLPEIYGVSIRGIIFIDKRILVIENKFGELKIPGGRQDEGETDIETLIREVKEETGYRVIPDSVVEFGEIEEKRLSIKEPMIWHHMSRMYFCKVEDVQGMCEYTEKEKIQGFRPELYSIDEAIKKNEAMFNDENENIWNRREYRTLMMIKEYILENGFM